MKRDLWNIFFVFFFGFSALSACESGGVNFPAVEVRGGRFSGKVEISGALLRQGGYLENQIRDEKILVINEVEDNNSLEFAQNLGVFPENIILMQINGQIDSNDRSDTFLCLGNGLKTELRIHVEENVLFQVRVKKVYSADGVHRQTLLEREIDESTRLMTLNLKDKSLFLIEINMLESEYRQVNYRIEIRRLVEKQLGNVYVSVFKKEDSHPAYIVDPVASPKHPVGSIAVENGQIDTDGVFRGSFSDLLLGDQVVGGEELVIFAYADNDISAPSKSAANFLVSPLTKGDFFSKKLKHVFAVPDQSELWVGMLRIDTALKDQDFDGFNDLDAQGEVWDNCPQHPNIDQQDKDHDGIGDVCDVCPDVYDPEQLNSDFVGKGDLCNDRAQAQCPYFDGYFVRKCSVDLDHDEIDDSFIRCRPGFLACYPDGDNVEFLSLDNCVNTYNPQQLDTDNNGVGDACDDDDDGDGLLDAFDNCPKVANPEQNDADQDGIGDACESDQQQ